MAAGKDVILHVLGELKRNTVALDRAVEFCGPGLAHMSADARFAIANMTTEFGGIVGVFEADDVTARVLQGRKGGSLLGFSCLEAFALSQPQESTRFVVLVYLSFALRCSPQGGGPLLPRGRGV